MKTGEKNLKLDQEAGQVPQRVHVWSERGDTDKLPMIDLSTNPFTVKKDADDDERSITSLVEGPSTVEDEEPSDPNRRMLLDAENGNTKWIDAEQTELSQIDEYDTFIDIGNEHPPDDYKKIRVHMVYDIKHDGRHKARLVADGHLTQVPAESVYSSVASLRSIRLVAFLAELNGLELWNTDVGNAHLESYTSEKVYIRAGPEFGE